MLNYYLTVEMLQAHKIRYYPVYHGIPVDKFEKEELLKIVDMLCEFIETHRKLGVSMKCLEGVFGMEF